VRVPTLVCQFLGIGTVHVPVRGAVIGASKWPNGLRCKTPWNSRQSWRVEVTLPERKDRRASWSPLLVTLEAVSMMR